MLALGRGGAAAAMAAMTIMSGMRGSRGGPERTLCMKGGDGADEASPQDFARHVRQISVVSTQDVTGRETGDRNEDASCGIRNCMEEGEDRCEAECC